MNRPTARLLHDLFESQGEASARLLAQVLQALLEGQMTEFVGAAAGQRTRARTGYRAGHQDRSLDTRSGRIDLRVPRDRQRLFATQLLDRYPRREAAFIEALGEMYLLGVSADRARAAAESLCGQTFSAATVARMMHAIDAALTRFCRAPLVEACPDVILQARRERVCIDGVRRSRWLFIAIGVDRSGSRCLLGAALARRDATRTWRRLLRGLERGGLHGVQRLLGADPAPHRVPRRGSSAVALAALRTKLPTARTERNANRRASRELEAAARDPWAARARRLARVGATLPAPGPHSAADQRLDDASAALPQGPSPAPAAHRPAQPRATDPEAFASIRRIADGAHRQWLAQLAAGQHDANPPSARELIVAGIAALNPGAARLPGVLVGGAGVVLAALMLYAVWGPHAVAPEAAVELPKVVLATAPEEGHRAAAPADPTLRAQPRHRLVGVSAAQTADGVALIATDGNPARAYRIGDSVDRGLVLLGVAPGGAILGSPAGQPTLTLEVTVAETVVADVATVPPTTTVAAPEDLAPLPATDLVPDALTTADAPAGKPSPGRRLRLHRPVTPH